MYLLAYNNHDDVDIPMGIYSTQEQAELHLTYHLVRHYKVVQLFDVFHYHLAHFEVDSLLTAPEDAELDHLRIFKVVSHIKGQDEVRYSSAY